MTKAVINKINHHFFCDLICQFLFLVFLTTISIFSIYSQQSSITTENQNTIIIDEMNEGEIFAFGKTVIIKKGVKGVLVFGGDLHVEGRVEEDVAVIGGSITQNEDAFIGGDVIVFGGKYFHKKNEPLRNSGKETIIYAGYEEELREITQNPSQIFAPQLSWTYFFQRIISVIFWFAASLIFVTIAPGAVSRAVARFQLKTLKIVGLGMLTFFLLTIFVIASLSYLPANISGLVGLTCAILILLAYFFGRVSLNVAVGKFLQKKLIPQNYTSESLAIFIGTFLWVTLLSIPYLGNVIVVLLFAASLGLILTGRSSLSWRKP